MSSKMPPVPPAERSTKGPGSDPKGIGRDATPHGKAAQVPKNLEEQGRTGNSHINTTNQGYQQDR